MQARKLAGLAALSMLVTGTGMAQGLAPTAVTVDPVSPIQHGPMQNHHRRFDGSSTSDNWSGYAITGSTFSDVKASWVEPTANCSKSSRGYAAFWVGIDGDGSSTVEQTGTDSDCSSGKAKYYAWYEFYPAASKTISGFTVKPGDKLTAEVSYSGSTFTTTITDLTTGKTSKHTGKVSGAARSSAEWIAEAPASIGVLPLSDFGTVDFGEDYTGESSTNFASSSTMSGPISAFPAADIDAITMASKTDTKATPSGLSADGTSFTVKWDASK